MKKNLSLLLLAVMLLSLCACGGNQEETPAAFCVGFGRVNITPNPAVGVNLDGYDDRAAAGVLNYVLATCVAITDEQNNTLLLYTVDMCNTEKETAEQLRAKLTASTGIPGDNITISATHTHSSPAAPYAENYVELLVQAGEEALADRAPATIAGGSYDVPNMNFDRHYVLTDGSMVGDNFGDPAVGFKENASVADPAMQLIRFQREGEKKDILMVNWQVHPKVASNGDTQDGRANRPMMSSDFVGVARDHVEGKEDVLMAYYTGAAGNVNPYSRIDRAIVTQNFKQYGIQFGDHVIAALAQLKPLETGNVGSKKAPLGDRGFYLHAYTVGSSLGFATVPAEIFHQTGTQIREGSSCEMTFVITCANGRDTYIPTENVWDYYVSNGDAPYEMRICRYPRGTAESIAKELGNMLTELAGK